MVTDSSPVTPSLVLMDDGARSVTTTSRLCYRARSRAWWSGRHLSLSRTVPLQRLLRKHNCDEKIKLLLLL